MHRPRSKRKQIIRTTVVYTVMISVILFGIIAGVLYTVGYRLNTSDGSLAQGGLLQVASTPAGARVSVDGRRVSGTTPMRVNAQAGTHTIKIARDGYRSWEKTLSIQPGIVLWANYARLVPNEPVVTVQREFDALYAVLPAVERDLVLAQTDPISNTFELINVGGDRAISSSLELPRSLARSPEQSEADPTYRMLEWDESDRLVLIEYKVEEYTGWIVFDTRSPGDSINVSELLDNPSNVSRIMFDERNGRSLYVLSNGIIRRLDTADRTLSAPLARNAVDMRQSNDGVITFATSRDAQGYRTVGYYTRGASESRTLQRFEASDEERVSLVIGEYQGKQYAAVQRDQVVRVSRLSLHSSDSKSSINLAGIASISAPENLSSLQFSPHDRFVYAKYGSNFVVYDIELDKTTASTVAVDEAVNNPTIAWLDRYQLWNDSGGVFSWYEFDGMNPQEVAEVAPGFRPKLTDNDRYLYLIQRSESESGFRLVQVQLRI